ncbi:putative tail protein [Salmonella phage 41]|nr:putative tail protein [Salmonella phage 41]
MIIIADSMDTRWDNYQLKSLQIPRLVFGPGNVIQFSGYGT